MAGKKYFVKTAACLIAALRLLGFGLAGDVLILKNGHLIDGTGGLIRENQVIVIKGNRIDKITPQPFLGTEGRVIER
ncbi:MAG: hypothetical protein ABIJ42_03525 [Acidobacteriota bacterium]